MIIKKSDVKSIDLSNFVDIVQRDDHKLNINDIAGHHHYKLLAYLSLNLNGLIVELGTHHGTGTLALCSNEKNRVISYDIKDIFGLSHVPENLTLRVENILNSLDGMEQLLDAELIFMDTAHTGDFEQTIFDWLKENNYGGILLLDDIFWANEMIKFWEGIDITKYDLTDIGHGDPKDILGPAGNVPGTGLVDFSNKVKIED